MSRARRRRVAVVAAVAVLGTGMGVLAGGPAQSETPGVTRWISTPSPAPGAVGITPGVSAEAAVSADGNAVAFSSTTPTIVSPPTDGTTREVYVYDARRPPTDPVERVSLTTEGRPGIGGGSSDPSLSADGRFVAFASDAVLDPATPTRTPTSTCATGSRARPNWCRGR